MITLKVPEGKYCDGCMFLDIIYVRGYAKCSLFNKKLDCTFKYGAIDTSSVEKCYSCPTESSEEE